MDRIINDLAMVRLEKNRRKKSDTACGDTSEYDKFIQSLSDVQQDVFAKVEQLWCEECAQIEKHAYECGFQDGACLMVETLQKKP